MTESVDAPAEVDIEVSGCCRELMVRIDTRCAGGETNSVLLLLSQLNVRS
jgi:hypothetical protein